MRAVKHTLWPGSDKHAVTCTSAHGLADISLTDADARAADVERIDASGYSGGSFAGSQRFRILTQLLVKTVAAKQAPPPSQAPPPTPLFTLLIKGSLLGRAFGSGE